MQEPFMSNLPAKSSVELDVTMARATPEGAGHAWMRDLAQLVRQAAATIQSVRDKDVGAAPSSAPGREACAESLSGRGRDARTAMSCTLALPQLARAVTSSGTTPREEDTMKIRWTQTSTALPRDGALVEFLLENRDSPLCGIYHLGRFESRWFFYAPPQVCRWRDLDSAEFELAAPVVAMIRRQRHCLVAADRMAAAA
jgi:hypothetical protein